MLKGLGQSRFNSLFFFLRNIPIVKNARGARLSDKLIKFYKGLARGLYLVKGLLGGVGTPIEHLRGLLEK